MGRGFVQYRLPESNRDEWILFSAFLDYRLPNGKRLHVLQDPAWCPSCSRFVVAEEIPDVESMEEEIAKFSAGDPETLEVWAFVSNGQPTSQRIAELRLRIDWRQSRRNAPRCLECGGFKTIRIPSGGTFRHPATGEPVVEVSSGWADTEAWVAEFTPEGDRITEQPHPPEHDGIPASDEGPQCAPP